MAHPATTYAEHPQEPRYVLSLWKGRLDRPPPPPTWRAIMADVATQHGLAIDDLCRPFGPRSVSHARQHAMWALRQERHPHRPHDPRWSYLRIAQMFWPTMDHTSVVAGCREHPKRSIFKECARG